MSDMLSIAQSGVRAYARALDVVADNVANAGTPGHVRRTANLTPAATASSPGPLELDPVGGNGVRLQSVGRALDALGADNLRRADAQVAALDGAERWMLALQSSLTGSAALDTPLNGLFDSLSDLASDPTNLALRQATLLRADALADRFNQNAASLERMQGDLLAEADVEARRLNSLAQGLADVNSQLRRATPGSSTAAALADERDRLLANLSGIVGIDVRFDARGQARVRIPDSGGALLVEAGSVRSARVVPGPAGLELRIGPQGADELAPVTGGVIAGLSAARAAIGQVQARLDGLAARVGADFNAAHMAGVDLEGEDGGALFRTVAPRVTAAAGNARDARVSAALADGAVLLPSELRFDGSDWTLSNGNGSVSGALPLTLDGLTVEAAGAAANGDLYRIGPAGAAAAIALSPLAAADLATSARWLAEAGGSNTGTALAGVRNDAPFGVPTAPPYQLTVLAGGQAELRDSLGTLLGSGPADAWISGDGFAVRLAGDPQEGDSYRIARAGAGAGNNGNAAGLLALRDRSGPDGTLGEAQDAMVARVTVALAEVRARMAVATGNRDGVAESLQAASGVDLNTEASEMLRLQQAYQANARLIQTARETFDAILAAAR